MSQQDEPQYTRSVASSQDKLSPPADHLPELEGYDLIDILGRGGMGMVYEAYQQSTGRRVAVKFMLDSGPSAGSSSPAARRRFEREVELIARLQHPNIVTIIDSGVQRGRYFYVMEFVDGHSFDHTFEPGNVDRRAVLELLIKISNAVDYAHQRGVLHRDLKPSNILIGAGGEPHIFDFGLGKAFDADDPTPRQVTLSEQGQLIGTLGYMAPEQARGDIALSSVRSDVYSLGAIAYELITGDLPCAVRGSLAEVLHRINSEDPRPPSAMTGKKDADLDAILLKSLEKNPIDRYATAGELAADIGRYLRREPITARHIGPAIRLGRWIQRRRAVALTVGLAAALLIAVGVTSIIKITAERDKFRNMYSTLRTMIESIDPDELSSGKVTAWSVLDHAAKKLDAANLSKVPEQEAEIREMLAQSYNKLSRIRESENQARRALELRESYLESPHKDIATSKLWIAAALWNKGKFDEAQAMYREVLATRLMFFDEASLPVAEAKQHLAACLDSTGHYEEAEQLYRSSLQTRLAILKDPLHEDIIPTLGFLGRCLQHQRKYKESLEKQEQCLNLTIQKWGPRSWRTARSLISLAKLWNELGEPVRAVPLVKEALDIRMEVLGNENESTKETVKFLADLTRATASAPSGPQSQAAPASQP